MKKDYFSGHSKIYAAFRPSYPQELYEFIFKHVKHFENAWDCATGNGQVAQGLCNHFGRVEATDISQEQLDSAFKAPNIFYSKCSAEETPFEDGYFDLITVGQALHWFDQALFFEEVKRVGKHGCMFAVWGYSILTVNEEIDRLFYHYYNNIVGSYWDEARKHIEEEYARVHFPFDKILNEKLYLKVDWSIDHFIGYLRSWSATQKFMKENNYDPLIDFEEELKKVWKDGEIKTATFPLFIKLCEV